MLKINLGVESATVLEKTRRAMNDLQSSVRRIASGVAIESAGDDPGAIGSITFTETAISGIQRTLKNLNEGITITQALSSDLNLVENLLLTLREVAEQAASEQFTDLQRAELQKDAQSILRKIDLAVKQAGNEYGYDLTHSDSINIDGTPELAVNTQIVLTDLLVQDLGKRAIYTSQRNGVFTSPLLEGDLIINGIAIRPTTNDDDSVSTAYESGSAIAKAFAINTATYLTGVTAEAGPSEIIGNRPISAVSLTGLNYLSINGSVITGIEVDDFDSNFASLQKAINAETAYTGVVASLTAQGELKLTASDGRNIQIKYSNQEVLQAIGVTDKEGDLANLFGAVELANPDRDLKGEVQLPIYTDFNSYTSNVSVGGRFDASEDYVDFVAQVVTAGSFGVAQFRLDRDPLSEATAIEDFAFIEGNVDPILNTTGVNGDFLSTGGFAAGSGSYNEAIDREYILTVTQEGTTDGQIRAQFEVSTVQDGVVGTFTASALTDINIAGARTGEDVTVYFSASPRNSSLTSTEAAGHEYDSLVTIGGTYNGDIDSTTTIEVTTSGRTQGTPQAFVQVYHDGLAYNAPVAVSADTPIDIGHGQTISFATDFPIFSPVTSSATGTYSQAITVDSNPSDFTGLGKATYELEISTAGAVGEARYIVKKDGVEISAGDRLVTAGTNLLEDGLSFNIPDAPPTIGATTVTTSHAEDIVDHYQDYAGILFTGNYDGTLNETSLEVRVKQEGIVLAVGEDATGRNDYATLEYRFGGTGSFTGDIIAREGGLLIERGVSVDLPSISDALSLIETSTGNDQGTSLTLTALSIGGYNGDIQIDIDPNQFTYGEDVKIVFSSATNMQIPEAGGTQTETLTVKLISENTGTLLSSTNIQPVSGATNTIGQGIDITFTNSTGASLKFTPDLGNNDFGTIAVEAGGTYSGSNDNDEILFRFENTTDVNVTRQVVSGNDGVTAAVGANVYNGIYGNDTVTLQLGTDPVANVNLLNTGANGVQDASTVGFTGVYNGANSNDDIRFEFVNRVSVNLDSDPANNDGSFSMTPSISGSQDISRDYANLELDIAVSKSLVTQATSSPSDVSVVGTASGAFLGDITFWRVNNQKFRVEVTPEGGVKNQVEYKFTDYVNNGILDLGDPAFSSIFGGVDPGFDLDVSGASVGQQYDFNVDEVFEYTFTDTATATQATAQSVGGIIDLNSGDLASTFFTSGDPGFDLIISNETDAVDDQFTLSWQIDPTISIYVQSGGSQQNRTEVQLTLNGDQSQGTFDLSTLTSIFTQGDPGIDLVIEQPLNAIDDLYGILGVNPSVSFSRDGVTVEGIALLDSYTLSDPSLASLFPDGSPGDVVINLTSKEKAQDDRFLISLESTSTVYVSEPDGTSSSLVTVQADGTIDLSQTAVTNLLNNNTDPGFDLKVTDLDRGIDDQYLLQLSSLPSLSAQADEQVALVNQHSLQVGDLFTVDLGAEKFAVGDSYSVVVDSEHLQAGSVYTVENTLGKFLVGDVLRLSTSHEFQAPTYTVNNSVDILNGLTLEFDQNGSFDLGDEIRFQVRGYTGDPVASGTYTYAISPTTFTVEITNTGDVDGTATFQYTRADTGETVIGLSVSSSPILLDDGVQIAFTPGRVYQGDLFYIDTFESLDQTFGGKLTLSSANTIEVEMSTVEGDNQLGRITYNGNTPKAPGTEGNLTQAFLALNSETAVGQIDLRTQDKAQKAVKYTGNAQDSLKSYQKRVKLAQSKLEDISSNLEDVLFDQTELLAQKLKVNVAQEGDRSAQAITQLASNSMLSAVKQSSSLSPVNLLQQSAVSIEPPISATSTSETLLDRFTGKTKEEKNQEQKQRLKEQERQKQKSAQRLQEMMQSIENAQQRSSAVMANMSALRQLAGAHIEANQSEMQIALKETAGQRSPQPNTSFNKLIEQVSASTKTVDQEPAKRQAQEAIKEAQSQLRDMKNLALAAQSASQFERESMQTQLNDLVLRLRDQALPSAIKAPDQLRPDSNREQVNQANVVFNSALSTQLGQYNSAQSAQGVDPQVALQDGEVSIQTALGQKVPVRATLPSDDVYSVRHVLGSALAKANAINSQSEKHGVTAIAGPTVAFGDSPIVAVDLRQESLLRLNHVEISGFSVAAGDVNGALTQAINQLTKQTGVQASTTQDGRLRLMALDGRNITIDAYGEATQLGLTPRGSGQTESRTTGGALTLSSRSFFTLSSTGYGASASPQLGQLKSVPEEFSLQGLDVKTNRGIIDSLAVIDLALADLAKLSDKFTL